MSDDARFEDGVERPLRLKAEDAEDLRVLAALIQDAVLPGVEMSWQPKKRQFSCLINRFRWEDKVVAERRGRGFERVQTLLVVDDVMKVATQGVDPKDGELVLSLLTLEFEPGEDGMGRVVMTFAGDGAIAMDVEAVNLTLQDVTRPYLAPSGKAPGHPS